MEQVPAISNCSNTYEEIGSDLKVLAKIGKDFLPRILTTIDKVVVQVATLVPAHSLTGEMCPHERTRIYKVSELEATLTYYETKLDKYMELTSVQAQEEVARLKEEIATTQAELTHYTQASSLCRDKCEYVPHDGVTEVPLELVKFEEKKPVVSSRLSKLQIKQILLYHFMHVDRFGFIRNVTAREVAEILGCDVRSVHLNNQMLQALDLIYVTNTGLKDYSFNVLLPAYRDYHLSKEKGGSGFFAMDKKFFMELLKIENINGLRNALFMYMKSDSDSVKKIYNPNAEESSIIPFDKLKKIVPKHLHAPHKIAETLEHVPNTFEQTIEDNKVIFKLKQEFNGKLIKQTQLAEARTEFRQMFEESTQVPAVYEYLEIAKPEIDDKQIEDLAQLTIEYGYDRTKDALEKALATHFDAKRYREAMLDLQNRIEKLGYFKAEDLEKLRESVSRMHQIVFNIGGFVRQAIRKRRKQAS